MSTEVVSEGSAVEECDVGENVDFTADDTESKSWDDVPFDQTPLENSHEEVKNEDIVAADAEAGAVEVEEEQHAEITEAPSEDVNKELADPQAEESSAVENESEPSYTCDMCQGTFEETEEEHLKGRKHLKLMERLEKYGSLEAIAAEFQPSTCYLCNVSSVSKSQMQMHLSGNKHKARCASLNLHPSAMDFPGKNRKPQTPAVTDAKTPGPLDPNSIVTERPACDVCNITLSSVPQLMQHLTGKRHKELVTALKLAVMRLPPNLRPPQLRMPPRKNDGKPPSGPTTKPAPVPKPGVAVQGPPAQALKRPGPPADGPTAVPAKKAKLDSNPEEGSAVQKTPGGKPAARKFSCDICNIRLNSEFQRNEHLKGKIHKDRLAELKGKPGGTVKPAGTIKAAGTVKPAGPVLQKGALLGNKPPGAPLGKQGSVPKMKSQQQQKLNATASFWCDVCQVGLSSQLHLNQHLGSNRHCENFARYGGNGPSLFAQAGKKVPGGAQRAPNLQGFAPRESQNWAGPPPPNNANGHFRTPAPPTQHQSSVWQTPSVQPQWGGPVLPTPAPSFSNQRSSEEPLSSSFGLLEPSAQANREQGAYGLNTSQHFSKLQLDLALEISKLSQHLARPEFSQELSQQLSHHLSQELSRQRQMATDRDRSTREDFGTTERLPLLGDGLRLRGEGAPLLGDGLRLRGEGAPLLGDGLRLRGEGAPLLDEGPLLRDKAPLIRDSFEDRAPRRPPLLGESGPTFSSREQDYSFERRDDFDRRHGIDSYGERRNHDFVDSYNTDYGSNHGYDDLPFGGSADFQRKPRSSAGGLLDRPPLLDSHSRF
ncbi:uncharacterized protein LOC144113421 [Amblyomma americanum]